jgi:hypothetical protein
VCRNGAGLCQRADSYNHYRLFGKSAGKRSLRRSRHKKEDNIQMDLIEIGFEFHKRNGISSLASQEVFYSMEGGS